MTDNKFFCKLNSSTVLWLDKKTGAGSSLTWYLTTEIHAIILPAPIAVGINNGP